MFPRHTSTGMECDQQPVRAEGTHRAATMLLLSTGSYPKSAQETVVLQKPRCIYRPSHWVELHFHQIILYS